MTAKELMIKSFLLSLKIIIVLAAGLRSRGGRRLEILRFSVYELRGNIQLQEVPQHIQKSGL